MNERELKAKLVFNELTLGEVYNLIKADVYMVNVEQKGMDRGTYVNFYAEDDDDQMTLWPDEGQEPDWTFNKSQKVVIKGEWVHLEEGDAIAASSPGCEIALRFMLAKPIFVADKLLKETSNG